MPKLANIYDIVQENDRVIYFARYSDPYLGYVKYIKETINLAKYTDLVERDLKGQTVDVSKSEWKVCYSEDQLRMIKSRKKEILNNIKSWTIGLGISIIVICSIVWFFNKFDYVAEVVSVENITVPIVDTEYLKYNIKENNGIVVQAKAKSGNYYSTSYMKFQQNRDGGIYISFIPELEIGEKVTLGSTWTQIKKLKENKSN